MTDLIIRDSRPEDMADLHSIYRHEVRHGIATFEEVEPGLSDFAKRRDDILKLGLPFLVAELEGVVVGYTYANQHRPRSAYRNTIEDSVYIDPGYQGQGIGRQLLSNLITHCGQGPWRQMIAIIGDSGNAGSIALHHKLGFRKVGVLRAVGFKLGRWVDTVIMQRAIGTGLDLPAEFSS